MDGNLISHLPVLSSAGGEVMVLVDLPLSAGVPAEPVRGVKKIGGSINMKTTVFLIDDPEMDHLIREAEEELKRLTPAQRRDLFGTSYLPPDPDQIIGPFDLEDEEDVPFFF